MLSPSLRSEVNAKMFCRFCEEIPLCLNSVEISHFLPCSHPGVPDSVHVFINFPGCLFTSLFKFSARYSEETELFRRISTEQPGQLLYYEFALSWPPKASWSSQFRKKTFFSGADPLYIVECRRMSQILGEVQWLGPSPSLAESQHVSDRAFFAIANSVM